MSIRAVWVHGSAKNNNSLLFLKKFASVEKVAKEKDGYVPLPEWHELEQATHNALTSNRRPDCQAPSMEIITPTGILWPALSIEQYGLNFFVIPLVPNDRPPLSEIPSVSAAFCLLLSAVDYLGPLQAPIDEYHPRLAELQQFLAEAAPLGIPLGAEHAPGVIQGKAAPVLSLKSKQKHVAWRSTLPQKSKNTLQFTISEKLNGDHVAGRVVCRADVDGPSPEVSMTLQLPSLLPLEPPLPITHPTVQAVTVQDIKGRPSWKMRLIPPTEPFVLCLYNAVVKKSPFEAVYQMKGEKQVNLQLQLKKAAFVPNNFEYFEVQMPFMHRGSISRVISSPAHGSVHLSIDKKTFIWKIGTKFPGRSLDLSLEAVLHFEKYSPEPLPHEDPTDEASLMAYAQIVFKIPNFAPSGLTLDPKLVNVTATTTKCKVTTGYEFQAAEFKVWNSNHG